MSILICSLKVPALPLAKIQKFQGHKEQEFFLLQQKKMFVSHCRQTSNVNEHLKVTVKLRVILYNQIKKRKPNTNRKPELLGKREQK